MTTPFSYDVFEYPSAALPQMHPGMLHAVARMYGADPVPVEHCRMLEVGCGDGTHLIACALAMPEAAFVGVDLSAAAIARGNRLIAELGLTNVALHAADLTTWEPPAEKFDYAAAHGLYSWVPAPVRDALLALFARTLAPTGVAYISYNTYPGCYIRRMVWEMMRFHTEDVADPPEKIAKALEFVKFLAAAKSAKADGAANLLGPEITHILEKRSPALVYHDDLAAVNDPVYFREFAAHAARHGLRFVADGEPNAMATGAYPPPVAAVLDGLAERDLLLKEQYIDFLSLRRFRQTLLSPDGRPPRKDPDAARVTTLAVSGRPERDGDQIDLSPGVVMKFGTPGGAAVRLDLPLGKAAFVVLADHWPGRLRFPDLVAAAAARLGREPTADDADALAALLTSVWAAGLVKLHGDFPRYATAASARPVASPLARVQVRTSPVATTLLHTTLRFDDPMSRTLIQLLDGTRDREQLAAELLPTFPADNRPNRAELLAALEHNLERLATAGLLVG